MGMVNAQTPEFDGEIVETMGYPKRLFPKLSQPGTVIGVYEEIRCVLCATHDTGSAVEGNEPYISSGAWSLLGVKTPKPIADKAREQVNYSNEGGVGYKQVVADLSCDDSTSVGTPAQPQPHAMGAARRDPRRGEIPVTRSQARFPFLP